MDPAVITPFTMFQNLRMELQAVKFLSEQHRAAYVSTLALLHQAQQEVYSLRQQIQEINGSKFLNSKLCFWDLSKTARLRRKQKVIKHLKRCMANLPKEFEPFEITFQVRGQELKLPLKIDALEELNDDENDVAEALENLTLTRKMLAAKDKAFISDQGYHELRMVLPAELREKVPPLIQLVKERREQDNAIPIHHISEALNADGGRRATIDVFSYLLDVPSVKEIVSRNQNKIFARFAADGRKTSAKIGSVMAVANLVGEVDNSADNQYTLALYNGKEDYDELKSCLGMTFGEIRNLTENGFVKDGVQYSFEWVCCCDWKFLALAYGLNPANSFFFCIWCYCTKEEISLLGIEDWPIERDLADCIELHTKKTVNGRKGCLREPLLQIPFHAVVPDLLHLFLRVMGMLLHQVIDAIVYHGKQKQLEEEMARIGTAFKFYTVQEEGAESSVKFTKLDGYNLKKVLAKLDVIKVLQGIKEEAYCQNVSKIWKGFEKLIKSLSCKPGDNEYMSPDEFKRKAKDWGKVYLYVYNEEDLTPYMHAMIYHVPQFLRKYGTIMQFSCQPVEKKNHFQNQMFHRGSQKGGKGSRYTFQILQRENRSLFAKKNSLVRQKRNYVHRATEEADGELECVGGISCYNEHEEEG